jgi:hypothetical protein
MRAGLQRVMCQNGRRDNHDPQPANMRPAPLSTSWMQGGNTPDWCTETRRAGWLRELGLH